MSLAYNYYPLVLQAITFISQGYTKTMACAKSNLAVQTFNGYIKHYPELKEALEAAEQESFDAMADALLDPVGNAIYGQSDAKMAKVMSDNIKFVIGKRDPKRFGERIEVRHEITMDKEIINAIHAGRNRATQLALLPDMSNVVDAEVVSAGPVERSDAEILAEIMR